MKGNLRALEGWLFKGHTQEKLKDSLALFFQEMLELLFVCYLTSDFDSFLSSLQSISLGSSGNIKQIKEKKLERSKESQVKQMFQISVVRWIEKEKGSSNKKQRLDALWQYVRPLWHIQCLPYLMGQFIFYNIGFDQFWYKRDCKCHSNLAFHFSSWKNWFFMLSSCTQVNVRHCSMKQYNNKQIKSLTPFFSICTVGRNLGGLTPQSKKKDEVSLPPKKTQEFLSKKKASKMLLLSWGKKWKERNKSCNSIWLEAKALFWSLLKIFLFVLAPSPAALLLSPMREGRPRSAKKVLSPTDDSKFHWLSSLDL